MEIVPAQAAHATALRELHLLAWEAAYRPRAKEAWYGKRLAAHAERDWAAVVRAQRARGGGVLSATCEGQIVGFCQYGPSEDRGEDPVQVGQIHRLYVDPRRQRAGIGRSLLAASVSVLRQERRRTVTLWVLESDRGARAFYARLGWRHDGGRSAGPPTDLRYRLAPGEPASGDAGTRAGPSASPTGARKRTTCTTCR